MAKDKGWQTKLSRTIVLKDGTALTTLADVRAATVAARRDLPGTQ
jgi:hypothetical protein